MKLNKDIIKKAAKVQKEYGKIEDLISGRITEIMCEICNIFGTSYLYWSLAGDYIYSEDYVEAIQHLGYNLELSVNDAQSMSVEGHDYTDGFPSNFLFISNAKIRKIVKGQIKKSDNLVDKEAEDFEAKKSERESVLEELTTEQRRILGV